MKRYAAKILLFGEHTVNVGSGALAMPMRAWSGHWRQADAEETPALREKQRQLPELARWLQECSGRGELLLPVDVAAFASAVSGGLIFDSDIPEGYGVGSSGALVAALLGEWGREEEGTLRSDLKKLRAGLAQIEGFFHGKSSGTDPLISFLGQPVLLSGPDAQVVELPDMSTSGLFLLDTGVRRSATPFIQQFLQVWGRPPFRKESELYLLPPVMVAIRCVMEGAWEGLYSAFQQISRFQLDHTPWLFPEAFLSTVEAGLHSGRYALKVCGAGGGGFLLGMQSPGTGHEEALHLGSVTLVTG